MILNTIRRLFGTKESKGENSTSQTATILGNNNTVTQNFNVYVSKSDRDLDVEETIALEVPLKVTETRFQIGSEKNPSSASERDSEPEAVHKTIDTYRDLVKDGKAVTAIELLKKLLQDFLPPYALYRATYNLGYAYNSIGADADAAEWWSRAAGLRPDDADARAAGALVH